MRFLRTVAQTVTASWRRVVLRKWAKITLSEEKQEKTASTKVASIASISPRSSFFIMAADKPNPQSQQTADSTESLSLNNATGTNSVSMFSMLLRFRLQVVSYFKVAKIQTSQSNFQTSLRQSEEAVLRNAPNTNPEKCNIETNDFVYNIMKKVGELSVWENASNIELGMENLGAWKKRLKKLQINIGMSSCEWRPKTKILNFTKT